MKLIKWAEMTGGWLLSCIENQADMFVLAVEPDKRLAATVREVVCDMVRADLTVVQSVERAIETLRTSIPDLILLPPLVSPADEASLVEVLRSLPGCSHIEMLMTPTFEEQPETVTPRGWRSWGARRAVNGTSGVDERKLFAERLGWSLVRARQQKELLQRVSESAPAGEPVQPVDLLDNPSETTALVPVSVDVAAVVSAQVVSAPSIARGFERNRRSNPRFAANELRGLREARIRFGPQVSLVDVSVGGALIETDTCLKPDTEAVLELIGNLQRTVPFRVVRSEAARVGGSLRYRGACAFTQPIDLADLLETRAPEPNVPAMVPFPPEAEEVLDLLSRRLPSIRREQLLQLLSSLRSGRPSANAFEREALELMNIALSMTTRSTTMAVPDQVTQPMVSCDAGSATADDPGDPSDRRQHLRVDGPFDGLRLGAIETPVIIRDLSEGGCFVDSLIDASPGRRLSIGLLVPGEDWITTTGEVIRGQQDFGFAVRFVNMPDDVRRRVARIVASRSRSHHASDHADLALITLP
jgi:PilZ domain-containing protein